MKVNIGDIVTFRFENLPDIEDAEIIELPIEGAEWFVVKTKEEWNQQVLKQIIFIKNFSIMIKKK
jgi:hypothetical protein